MSGKPRLTPAESHVRKLNRQKLWRLRKKAEKLGISFDTLVEQENSNEKSIDSAREKRNRQAREWYQRNKAKNGVNNLASGEEVIHVRDALIYLRKAYELYPEVERRNDPLPAAGKMFLALGIKTLEGKA